MPAAGTVRIDPVALAKLINSPAGPVVRHTIIVADLVASGARERVGYNAEKGPGLGAAGGAEHLRDTITKRFVRMGNSFSIWVGSSSPIAMLHHNGTKPHEIVPVRGRYLVFYWPKVGRVVFLRKVQHPGTKANPFLVDAARAIGLTVRPIAGSSGFGFTF